MPIPPPTSSGRGHVEPEAVAERAEDGDLVARRRARRAPRPGPDRVDQEGELAARREAERERPRQHAAGRLEHEELARAARVERAARDAQRACTGRSPRRRRRGAAHDAARQASGVARPAWRSWSESGSGARVRDRLDRGARDGERRDARNARDDGRLADRVAVAARVAALGRVDDEVDRRGGGRARRRRRPSRRLAPRCPPAERAIAVPAVATSSKPSSSERPCDRQHRDLVARRAR